MNRLSKILAVSLAAGLAAIISGTSATAKRGDLYYEYTFYSDGSYTNAVGGYRQYCYNNTTIVTGEAYGEQTPYVTSVPLGQCPGLGDW